MKPKLTLLTYFVKLLHRTTIARGPRSTDCGHHELGVDWRKWVQAQTQDCSYIATIRMLYTFTNSRVMVAVLHLHEAARLNKINNQILQDLATLVLIDWSLPRTIRNLTNWITSASPMTSVLCPLSNLHKLTTIHKRKNIQNPITSALCSRYAFLQLQAKWKWSWDVEVKCDVPVQVHKSELMCMMTAMLRWWRREVSRPALLLMVVWLGRIIEAWRLMMVRGLGKERIITWIVLMVRRGREEWWRRWVVVMSRRRVKWRRRRTIGWISCPPWLVVAAPEKR